LGSCASFLSVTFKGDAGKSFAMPPDSLGAEEGQGLLSSRISTLIVQALHEYSGRGPTKAKR